MAAEIQIANTDDRGDFLRLWGEFLREHEKLGSDMRATDRTLDFFGELFDAYVSGLLCGVPLIARGQGGEPVGVLLWGALPPAPFDRTDESTVCGWGAYTAPTHRRQGISRALRKRAVLEMHAARVKTVLGSAVITNQPGVESSREIGFNATSLNGTMDVADEARRIRSGEPAPKYYYEGDCPLCGRGATP